MHMPFIYNFYPRIQIKKMWHVLKLTQYQYYHEILNIPGINLHYVDFIF